MIVAITITLAVINFHLTLRNVRFEEKVYPQLLSKITKVDQYLTLIIKNIIIINNNIKLATVDQLFPLMLYMFSYCYKL